MTTSIRTLQAGCGIVTALLVASSALAQPFAYVSGARTGANNRVTQVLTVIDVARRAKVASIPLGESCLCVGERAAVSADGARVYVSNYWSNTVSVIDTGNQQRHQDLRRAAVSRRAGAEPRRVAPLHQYGALPEPGVPGAGARHGFWCDHRQHPSQRAPERFGNGDFPGWQAPVRDQPGAQRFERQDHRHGHQCGHWLR